MRSRTFTATDSWRRMFTRILVPRDRSPLAEQAIPNAVAIADASNATLDFVLFTTRSPSGDSKRSARRIRGATTWRISRVKPETCSGAPFDLGEGDEAGDLSGARHHDPKPSPFRITRR